MTDSKEYPCGCTVIGSNLPEKCPEHPDGPPRLLSIEAHNAQAMAAWQAKKKPPTGIECPTCKAEMLKEHDFPGMIPPQMLVVCPKCATSVAVLSSL